jgi:purine-binding chemotaxis protein CheW
MTVGHPERSEGSALEIPDAELRLLEDRARALARPIDRTTADRGHAAVTFTLARERYMVDARYVHAAFRLRQLVRIPGATLPVVAVTRWRGDVVTLIDIRSLVGAPTGALDDLAVVIILGGDRPEFGLLADALEESARISDEDVLPLQSRRGAEGDREIVRGVTRDARLVLDAPALIARQMSADQSSRSQLP